MKLDKLAKQLRRDLSASPKKAAALGVMLLVAAYFWLPMIWGWLGPKTTQKPVATGSVILEDEHPTSASAAAKASRTFPWEQVRRRMLADPLMASAEYDAAWLDPFRRDPLTASAPPAGPESTNATPSAVLDPAGLGLVLTGAVVGPKRRTAIISGRSYLEGEIVKPNTAPGPTPIEFCLEKITARGVELTAGGKSYTLKLGRAQLGTDDELIDHHRARSDAH
ncbi:MAG: hypothetical protein MUF06_09190 [Pirellulaceae bacterium]|nr:hypothetical protein [Pirellulaceae bacterium]